MANNLLQMAQPASTNVHNNIDNLILQADLDKFDKTGVMYADKTPQYIGGADDVVANVALGPLLTLKSMGSVGKKILEKTGLRNPISHYTGSGRAKKILESGEITSSRESGSKRLLDSYMRSPSLTRDPMFLDRPHANIGTNIKFVFDRDELIKFGKRLIPYTSKNYEKTLPYTHTQYGKMNPRFEFEERVVGPIPSNQIKLIDFLNINPGAGSRYESSQVIKSLLDSNIPIIRDSKTTDQLNFLMNVLGKYGLGRKDNIYKKAQENVSKMLATPTY